MNSFTQIPRDVRENQIYRDSLLAQPAEFFHRCMGIVPDMMQRIHFVETLIQRVGAPLVYVNDTYMVKVRRLPPFVHLDISRLDSEPRSSWSDFQQIKNELVGPECEGMELFPAESRLVNTAHQYHLWVHSDAGFRFPIGYDRRVVFPEPLRCQGRPGDFPAQPGGQVLTDDSMGALQAG